MIRVFCDPGFAAPLGNHIMPIGKFALVAEALAGAADIELVSPAPVTEADLMRVHSKEYIDAIRTGEPRSLAESQKFPWTSALYSSVLLTNGGALAAGREALIKGYSAALASGFHHSHREHGEGFCTFNGLIVSLEAMKASNEISSAAILDMDLHYGNGTSLLVRNRPWIQALSLYGNDYWDNVAYRDVSELKHEDGPNHKSAALPAGCDGKKMLEMMEQNLEFLLANGKPDLLFYQAGADPYYEDPYSPLNLDHQDLLDRDRRVFEFAREHSIPIAWVLAGGYTPDISKIVKVHVNTFQAWREVYHAP